MIASLGKRLEGLIDEGVDFFIRERECLRKQTNLRPPGENFEMEKLENKIATKEALKRMFKLTEPREYGIKNNTITT